MGADRLWNELLAKITEAEQKGEETDDPYALPFAGGISREDVEALSKWGTRYQVIGGAVFRSTTCEGVEYFLRRLAPRLGDTEFILNSHDVPRIEKGGETPRPLFSFSKNDRFWDVMYPAWAFWKGGPALSIYPTGIGDWNKTSQLLLRTSEEWPWERKEDRGFFLGSRTSSARDPLVLLSRRRPEFVLASYTKNQGYRGPKDTLHAEPAKEEPFEKNCQFRYLFNFRGVAASFRFKHLFLCGSLVFHVDDGWKEFFYGQLTPWLHYVPISVQENTEEHLEALLEFFQEHQDLARRIAERGQKRICERLGVEDVEEYWLRLLTSYSSLLNFSPVRDETLSALT